VVAGLAQLAETALAEAQVALQAMVALALYQPSRDLLFIMAAAVVVVALTPLHGFLGQAVLAAAEMAADIHQSLAFLTLAVVAAAAVLTMPIRDLAALAAPASSSFATALRSVSV
jgi:hypothetical protein